jgi:putative ABC transport system permease protein
MAAEMRQHIEALTDANIADGMSPEEARNAAMKRFGGLAQIQERCRDEHGFVWLGQFLNDVRFAVRSLCRARGFSATILATLILGIGVTTIVFNLTAAIVIYAQPYPKPDQLFFIGFKDKQNSAQYYRTGAQFQAYQEQTNSFEEFAAIERSPVTVAVDGEPVSAAVNSVSVDCFKTLGIRPALGRGFLPEEFRGGANNVVVISDLFWRQHFNSAPNVLGREVMIDRQACAVVGVLLQNQRLPALFTGDVFRPLVLRIDPAKVFQPVLFIIGRLKPGVSQEQALATLSSVKLPAMPQWAIDYFAEQTPVLTRLNKVNRPDIDWLILGAAVLLYGIACLNAMNLMLIRILGRRRELSIRFAVGGSRRQVIQLLVIESAGLALFASLVVILAARFIFPTLFELITRNEASLYHSYWDWGTLACIANLSILASLAVVLVPAYRLLKTEVNSGLKDGGPTLGESRGTGRVRDFLVVLQAAFAVILLAGTGLMVRSFERLHHLDLGFDPVGKVKVQLIVPSDFDLKPEARIQLFERLQRKLGTLPGVRSVSFSQDSIFVGSFAGTAQLQMEDGSFQPVAGNFVSHDFLDTAGLVLKKGRWISGERGHVEAVINETFAKARFGDRDPIGLSFKIKVSGDIPYPVVGVVRDVRDSVRSSAGLRFYVPYWMYPPNINSLVLRLDSNPKKEFSGLVRRAIYEVEPRLVIANVGSIDELVSESMWAERYAYMVLKGLASIALVLTVVGCFSVVQYTVDRRMTEFGVRIALGAQSSDLHRLVMVRGLGTTAVGLVIGTACALGLVRFMSSLLIETTPFDPLVYLGVAVLLISTGAVACLLPARRAARADVVSLLRAE